MRNLILAAMLAVAPLSAAIPILVALPAQAATLSALGDLSAMSAIVTETLTLTQSGDLVAAEKRITDFETAWDQAAGAMQPLSPPLWGVLDVAADNALAALRAASPNQQDAEAALNTLLAKLDDPAAGASANSGGAVAVAATAGILVVTNADGSPLPCEVALKSVRDLNATKPASDQPKFDELMNKGLERCNADDDKRADAFFADAYALLQ